MLTQLSRVRWCCPESNGGMLHVDFINHFISVWNTGRNVHHRLCLGVTKVTNKVSESPRAAESPSALWASAHVGGIVVGSPQEPRGAPKLFDLALLHDDEDVMVGHGAKSMGNGEHRGLGDPGSDSQRPLQPLVRLHIRIRSDRAKHTS
jgi:hypothetical protein